MRTDSRWVGATIRISVLASFYPFLLKLFPGIKSNNWKRRTSTGQRLLVFRRKVSAPLFSFSIEETRSRIGHVSTLFSSLSVGLYGFCSVPNFIVESVCKLLFGFCFNKTKSWPKKISLQIWIRDLCPPLVFKKKKKKEGN